MLGCPVVQLLHCIVDSYSSCIPMYHLHTCTCVFNFEPIYVFAMVITFTYIANELCAGYVIVYVIRII